MHARFFSATMPFEQTQPSPRLKLQGEAGLPGLSAFSPGYRSRHNRALSLFRGCSGLGESNTFLCFFNKLRTSPEWTYEIFVTCNRAREASRRAAAHCLHPAVTETPSAKCRVSEAPSPGPSPASRERGMWTKIFLSPSLRGRADLAVSSPNKKLSLRPRRGCANNGNDPHKTRKTQKQFSRGLTRIGTDF